MPPIKGLTCGGRIALIVVVALGGCGKLKQNDEREPAQTRAAANRQKAACGSSRAYDRLKGLLFDKAVQRHEGDRANLDALADYSTARMEDPVVKGWDPALDITRCEGWFILEIPPGAERAFAGERRLQADINYTAQAAADGSGLVYQLNGAEPIIARLAAFNLTSGGFRPPPAVDEGQSGPSGVAPTAIAATDLPEQPTSAAAKEAALAANENPYPPARQGSPGPERVLERNDLESREPLPASSAGGGGEATVRAFYAALREGNGAAASAQIVPEKRSSRAFSPEGMSRFYGALPEPIRLTGIAPLEGGAYRVRYLYSAGRSRCDGSAIVSLTNRGGRPLIRSIRALSGC